MIENLQNRKFFFKIFQETNIVNDEVAWPKAPIQNETHMMKI